MNKLNDYDIQFLIERLQKGEPIPEDYKYKLFPVKQKEYELVYAGKMRKEDILANEDGVFPVPLQVEKVFNGEEYPSGNNDWRNMIVFGDNLQFLKTVYENKDPLIKNKVKGKVKLIYIDPPFATESDFVNKGQKVYTDKAKGAEFVEFLRRRLILAREILADDGSFYVHLDQKMSHYIKILMDEIFGKQNFINELIWNYKGTTNTKRMYARKHDNVLFYCKNISNYIFNPDSIRIPFDENSKFEIDTDGKIFKWWEKGEKYYPPQEIVDGKYQLLGKYRYDVIDDVPSMATAHGIEYIGYPTQKKEDLLKIFINASTNKDDLILDFFSGSGTTAAVSEKLNRRWIVCDIGKLAFYTMQKRVLTIENSKDLENPKKKYDKKARSFVTVNTGLYDLRKVFELKKDDYISFVMNLFEVESIDKRIAGIKIDGQKKDGYYCLVYPYWQFTDAAVDEEYLEDLHSHIGSKIGERLYIIAPANYVDFISDYHEIGKTRYYFLKVPYQIIKELHKVQFKKFRQPQSKKNVNDLDDAVGFHFIRQPEVESRLKVNGQTIEIQITKFLSNYLEEETEKDLENLTSIAMVLIDKDYNGKEFVMDEFYFADDLLPKKKEEETEEEIKEELKHLDMISIPLNRQDCGDKIVVVYVDVYGNEFKEILSIKR